MTAVAASRSRGRRTSSPSRSLGYSQLLTLREFGKTQTDDRCLRGCGRRIRRGDVGDADEILETTVYCHRAWLCPVCGYRARRRQSRGLAQTLMAWTSQGGSLAVLTLTQRHSPDDELDNLWDRLEDGWDAMVRGSGWRADRKSFGVRGYARITEVVHHPESGWNVHFHVPLLLDDELDDQQLYELQDRVTARFTRGIGDAGGRASCGGQDLGPIQPGSERRRAGYYAKGTTVWRSETGRGGGRRPGGRRGADLVGSRTPMAILADLKETGEGLGLWKEFSAAVTRIKRRRYSPSQGIATLLRERNDVSSMPTESLSVPTTTSSAALGTIT